MSRAAPTPVGGDGQLRGIRRQTVATALAPIVKELFMRFIPETEAPALRAHLDKKLEGPVTLDLFIEPKSALVVPGRHQAAVESGNVTADVVEISEFPDLAAQYHVRAVPKIVMNDTVELVGAQPEAAFVDAMLRATA